jgi:hypothetical protein
MVTCAAGCAARLSGDARARDRLRSRRRCALGVDNAEALSFEDPAEQQVLWNIEGQLEKKLVAPLDPSYQELLAEARKLVRES